MLLIGLGGVFLMRHYYPDLPLVPAVLILMGVCALAERIRV
jgi:hypothetical protein